MSGERQAGVDALAVTLARLERAQRCAAAPALRARLGALQAWQGRRLAAEYADQRSMPRRREAVDFFLEEVYGAHDFTDRDAQFARAVHRLRVMLPPVALQALRDAVELQALTLELDVAVAERVELDGAALQGDTYATAYRAADRPAERRRQVDLALSIGRRLEHLTSHPTIELMLRLAAAPARLAGYGALQSFIERGYAAFRQLGPEAPDFLRAIGEREEAFRRRITVAPADATESRDAEGGDEHR